MNISMHARVSRYPAKMVPRLATRLIDRYATKGTTVFDPFCGSGELLLHAARKGLPVGGCDLNPYAVLLARVRVEGFRRRQAQSLLVDLFESAERKAARWPIDWSNKSYWFSPRVLDKYEALRAAAKSMRLHASAEGRSVLLALALSARICSRADERSPKLFISKEARRRKGGRHVNPASVTRKLHAVLCSLYGDRSSSGSRIAVVDWASPFNGALARGKYSLVMTSPPYLNAQDYFRNFKLELYLLEGLLPFQADEIATRFIGTERGDLIQAVDRADLELNRSLVPELRWLESTSTFHAEVVHRYFKDMRIAFDNVARCMKRRGKFVLVCGDNLIASRRIRTWAYLRSMLLQTGWREIESFSDRIRNRSLPPRRSGHKGLIKEERVMVFERRQAN